MTQLDASPGVGTPVSATAHRPSALRLGAARGGYELKSLWREKPQLLVTIVMPFAFLVVLNSVFNDSAESKQLLATALIAVSIMSTALQGVALQVAQERREGHLLRLRGLPMPAVSYFMGKTIMVIVTSLVQITVMLGLGHALYKVRLPTDVGHWLTFAWVYALGVVCCTLLGLALSMLIRGENGGSSVIMPFVALQMISGVFVPFNTLPPVVRDIASVFPLKWMCQGMRSAFLPDRFLHVEVGGAWHHSTIALVLAGWAFGGLVLCLTTFRWRSAGEG